MKQDSLILKATLALAASFAITTAYGGTITGELSVVQKASGIFGGNYSPGYPAPPHITTDAPAEEIVELGTGWLDWDIVGQGFSGMMNTLSDSMGSALFSNLWHAQLEYVPANQNDVPSGSYQIGYRLSDVAGESVYNQVQGPTYANDNVRWASENLIGGRLTKPVGSSDDGFATYYYHQVLGSPGTGTLYDTEGGVPGTIWVFARVKFQWHGSPTNKWLANAYLWTGVGSAQWATAYDYTAMGFSYGRNEQVELYSINSDSRPLLKGTLDPNGGHPDKPRGKGIIVDFREEGTSTVVYQAVLTPEADGTDFVYEIPTPDTEGTYDLSIQYDHCLRKTITVDTSDLEDPFNIDLINGDINLDNAVDIGDYAIYSIYYGMDDSDEDWSTPDIDSGRTAEDCDLDGDGEIAIGDYAILSANYDEEGDE